MQLDYKLPRLLQCLPGGHKGAASKAEEEMSRDPQAAVGQKEKQEPSTSNSMRQHITAACPLHD